MALNIYNIKKWYLMLTGKSVLHVNQDIGKFFVSGKISGYYNNMTEKVTKEPELLKSDKLPEQKTENGDIITFPVAVFQYGLGAYDLYIKTNENIYLEKFRQCVDWALKNQQADGAWSNFFFVYKDNPYGAMCQGEGASLLVRAYSEFKDSKYLDAASKAVDFMLKSVSNGGTAHYDGDDVILLEYTHKPAVMNGWIFALWGLYDLNIVNPTEKNLDLFKKTVSSLIKYLPEFDCKYWSKYALDGKIASPFYHHLHIAQMQAMYAITGESAFDIYAKRWLKNEKNLLYKGMAFVKKAIQKVME